MPSCGSSCAARSSWTSAWPSCAWPGSARSIVTARSSAARPEELESAILRSVNEESQELDAKVAPLAKASGEQGNPTWGPLMRAGNDKSLFARQVERYADVYTSRVSNFLAQTPFAYLRAARGSLPHDDGV